MGSLHFRVFRPFDVERLRDHRITLLKAHAEQREKERENEWHIVIIRGIPKSRSAPVGVVDCSQVDMLGRRDRAAGSTDASRHPIV